ncbi:hypothetical protein F5Y05DRAFT_423271 [Hypoxylon sp. FL0543]|nr:hypothetical protein F5Y05DRAFT_423271 [Hypoxylon sp. FL0543]
MHRSLHQVWLITLWLPLAASMMDIRNSSTDLVPIYRPYLSNLRQNPAIFSPYVGGQDWNMCCKLVVNESLVIQNDTLYIRPGQTFFTGTIETLEAFPRFPCGATYNGTLAAPHSQFWIPFSWCITHCPGWPATKVYDLEKWLKPMIAFILPSLIFCLNIPRRRQLELPARLFSNKSIDISGLPLFLLKLPLASFIITVDVIIWTCVVFSAASPMITSGIYEAILDARVMTYLESRVKENSISVREKAHMLLSVLIGNLDIEAWDSSRLFVRDLPGHCIHARYDDARIARRHTALSIQSQPVANTPTSSQANNTDTCNSPRSNATVNGFHQTSYSTKQLREISTIKLKLNAMLSSQVGFGTSVGAPVLFYIASYIWSVYEVREELGSYVTAHQLAAGMFWMTIPHIALVSCLLLAGNNPNIWQNAVAETLLAHGNRDLGGPPRSGSTDLESNHGGTGGDNSVELALNGQRTINQYKRFTSRIFDHIFTLAFKESVFKPASMWKRGSHKAMWIMKLGDEYPYLRNMREEVLENSLEKDLWTSSFYGWALYFVPTLFGIVVSYNTPRPGFGCRSIIMLAYVASQMFLQMLWLLRWYFYNNGERENISKFWSTVAKSTPTRYLWYFSFAFATFIAALSSIGGTIFSLTNVLTNCFCAIPARYWWDRWSNPEALVFVDDATYEQLYYAQKWWFPAGVAGVVFMTFVAYIGWWYQRSLRHRFHELVDQIDYISDINFHDEERRDVESIDPAGG